MSDVLDKARSLKLTLELAADKLDEHFANVRIARIVGSSVGASCAVVTIGSGIAIPFTLGISFVPFILSVVFASVGTVGTITAGGASIAGTIIEKKKLAEMNTQLEQFNKECSDILGLKSKQTDMNKIGRIQEILKKLTAVGGLVGRQVYAMVDAAKTVGQAPAQTAVAGVTNVAETASVGVTAAVETAATAGTAGANVSSSGVTVAATATTSATRCAATATKTSVSGMSNVAAIAKTATTTAKTATTGAATTARVVAAIQAPIVIVNVALLGLSIYDLVTASIDLHKKNKSKAGDLLRQMAAELDTFFKEDVPTLDQVEECLAFGG